MRIAVIGAGSIGRRHIGNLLALGCDVYGYDPSPEARQRAQVEYPAARLFGLLAGDERYDAWVIATPYDQHLYFAWAAVAARIPFFVEKPLGAIEQLGEWRALVRQADGLTTQVGYQCRFHPKAQAMKLLFPEPDWGRFNCGVDMTTWPGQGYGPLVLEASHDLDLALWLGAPPDAQVSHVANLTRLNLGSHWLVTIFDRPGSYFRNWSVGTFGDLGAEVYFESPEALGDQMYRDEMAYFLDCVSAGKPTLCPLSDGLRVLEVCQQMEALSALSA